MKRMLTLGLLLFAASLFAQAQSCPIQVVDFKLVYVPRASVKNLGNKPIREITFLLALVDSTENFHWQAKSFDWRQPIQPGDTRDYDWPRQMYRDNFHVGSMLVPTKVVFADGSVWRPEATSSGDMVSVDGSCSGQFWVNKNHPATRTFQLPVNLWQ